MRNMTLKEYLKKHGISQAEIARKSGTSRAQVCHWLKGDHRPSLDAALRIAEATHDNVTVADWGKR